MSVGLSRRFFVGGLAAAGAAHFMGCRGAGNYRANSKVRLAVIGCGGQGAWDVEFFERYPGLCEIVALVDTDIGAEHTLKTLRKYPSLPRFTDFRRMFDRMEREIDAVLVATPDHAHFCMCLEAIRRGKAVYVEKPLAHSFRECELLMKAEAEEGVVCQMGNQGHSGDNFYQYRDYVAAGIIKDVVKVVSHMNMERRWHKWGGKVNSFPKGEKMPPTLDWDTWIGPAPYNPFSKDLAYGEWRCWFDYGMGCMGDWGAHILDCVHRFTLKGALPEEVRISALSGANRFVFPIEDTVTMKFKGGTEVEWYEGLGNKPKLPKGFRYADNKGLFPASTANDGLIDPPLKPGKEIYLADGTVWQGLSHSATLVRCGAQDEKLPPFERAHDDHWENFLRAVRGEAEVKSPFSVTGPLSEIFCLAVIAQRLGRSFRFDPVAKRAVGDREVDSLLDGPPPRKGWECYYKG